MAFIPKEWKNGPGGGTPLSAEAIIDLETRVTNYAKETTVAVVKTVATSGASQTLPAPTEFGIIDLTLTANCTITLPTVVKGGSFMLWLRQNSGGPWTVTWTGSPKWSYGASPSLTPSIEVIDVVSFSSPDGTAWYGFPGGYEFK